MTLGTPADTSRDIHEWLADATLRGLPVSDLVAGFCARLTALGFPLERVLVAMAALDPNVRAQSLIWSKDGALDHETFAHGQASSAWQDSPMAMMLRTHTGVLRQRLDETASDGGYLVFDELKTEGYTDWVAYANTFHWTVDHIEGGEMGVLTSWTTKDAGGFTDQQLAQLQPLVRALAAAIKTLVVIESADNVLAAYVGKDAGDRVLRGSITRGSVLQVRAVLMFADLRGFTRFSAEQPIDVTLSTLNRCFECVGEAIEARGGQILKFMGDGVLAVFMLDQGVSDSDIADHAIDAAIDTQKRLAASDAPLALDIALHVGTVNYGNVGTSRRLDFTVIGQAVNEVARLESLCGSLGEAILVSGALAALASKHAPHLRALGAQSLRGLTGEMAVFGTTPSP